MVFPSEADFVIDVRCLPNPYWVENLRSKTGLDKEVRDYVFSFDESRQLLDKLIDMLDFLNPLYIKEGKAKLFLPSAARAVITAPLRLQRL